MTATQIVIVVVVAAVGALVKGVTGMGYPIILVPVAALFIDATEAVVLVTFSNFGMNAQLVRLGWAERSNARTVRRFVASAVVGGLIGGFMLAFISDRLLRVVLIVVVVAFIASRIRSPNIRIPDRAAHQWSIPVGMLAGLFQGAAGISGPIVTPWFISLGLARNTFVFCIALVFGASGLAQIVALGIGGLYNAELVILGLVLIPVTLLVVRIGVSLRPRLAQERFEQVVLGLLGLSALGLAVKLF